MKTYSIKTLGCKANLYDSQLLEAELQKRGWTSASAGDEADLCIVNSCSVTDEADRQSKKTAAKASSSKTRVVMTGCGAEIDPQGMSAAKGVDFVVGNQDKERLVDLVLRQLEEGEPSKEAGVASGLILGGVASYGDLKSRHPMDRDWNVPESSFMLPPAHLEGQAGRTRSFIKIQEGCDSFCTYCIIPYGRGPSRSLSLEKITEQVQQLVSEGVREIVITGTNIGDYGRDWNGGETALEMLVETLLKKTQIERLRLSSLDPVEISPRLLEIMRGEPRLCPHFHVSLQSPSAKILKLMKRKYSAPEVVKTLNAIADLPAPAGGVFVGMDVITGFPGETDADFEESIAILRDLPWSRLHVFPYSERKGTPATRLPGKVPQNCRAERAQQLRDLSLERLMGLGHEVLRKATETNRGLAQVLMESETRGPIEGRSWWGGYTPNYFRVIVDGRGEALSNRILTVRPESVTVDRNGGDIALIASLS